jgi:uncharacterized cupin superfamily protein
MSEIFNLQDGELESTREPLPEGRRFLLRSLSSGLGAELTGLSVYELPPGHASWPYHFEVVEEEWLIVVAGEVTLRTPDGEQQLCAGDVACFPPGAAGAHAVENQGETVARFAMPSSVARYGDAVVYPDSGKFRIATKDFSHRGRLGEHLEYWEGEA